MVSWVGRLRSLLSHTAFNHALLRLSSHFLLWLSIVESLVHRSCKFRLLLDSFPFNHDSALLGDFRSQGRFCTLFMHHSLQVVLSAHLERNLVLHELRKLACLTTIVLASLPSNHLRLLNDAFFFVAVTLCLGLLIPNLLLGS